MHDRIISLGLLIISFYFQSCGVFYTYEGGKIEVYSLKEAEKHIVRSTYDTIVLKDGVYKDIFLKFPEESSNIVLTSQTPGGAVITGKSRIFLSGKKIVLRDLLFYNIKGYDPGENRIITLKNTDSCRITNCAFIDCGTPYTNQKETSGGILVYLEKNSKNNRIDHCYWEGSFGLCLAIGYYPDFESSRGRLNQVNSNNQIDSCYINNISEWEEMNGNDPFMIGWNNFPFAPNSNNVVKHNLFENISSDSEIISVKLSNTTVAYNTFRNSPKTKYQCPQVSIRSGNNSIVKGNFFLNTGCGIRIFGDNHEVFDNYFDTEYMGIELPGAIKNSDSYQNQNNCNIYNNTIVNTQYPFMFGKGDWSIKPGGKKSNNIYNNIVYLDGTKLGDTYNKPRLFLDRNYNSSRNIKWRNNTIYSNVKHSYTVSKFERFISDYKISKSGIETTNPHFEIDKHGLYRLKTNSKLISLKRGANDMLIEHKKENAIDRGYEPSQPISITVNKPLEKKDVGPTWISDYTNFKKELIDYWKQWEIIDSKIDNNPAILTTPHFNASTSILQFDLTKVQGFEIEYDDFYNEYIVSSRDNRPRVIELPILDFNENEIPNTKGNSTIARIENWIVKKVACSDKITITGNGDKIQFSNDRLAPMLISAGFETPSEVGNGEAFFLAKNKKYFVSLANETIYRLKNYKKHRKCRIGYTIKPTTSDNN